MTQEEVEKKIRSYAKKKNITFDNDKIILEISIYISNPITMEAYQKDRLQQLYSLFNGIKKAKRGDPLHDKRNGKIVCTKIKSNIKKYMSLHFETIRKNIFKYYKVYKFEVAPR
jgi:tryptophanyl-tRNA synthetase